ncbi:MAG: methyltransferase domain-containing protein, partial [Actinomycetes bacterium]
MSDLAVRDRDLRELMDDPDCDLQALRKTYAQFRVMNRLVAGWHVLYRQRIRPRLDARRPTTLLDIGSGGGDIARALAGWAARDGRELRVTAVDPDPRAYAFATGEPAIPGLEYRAGTSADLVAEGRRYDVVISNHLLHHLTEAELARLLHDSAAL